MGSWNPPGVIASCDLNLLLVGPRRTGKSSTGNTLLGREQVFDTKGGGASTTASATTTGRHVTVVDSQGWGSSEEFVPREEKIELMRALSLCGLGGPHVILLVIQLLDFSEPERRALERRMEMLTPSVWRHTMVLFTCGDLNGGRGLSVEERIQSSGPALQWLMKKCRYRYHVFDNKKDITKQESRRQEVQGGGKKRGRTWWKNTEDGERRKNGEGEAVGRKCGEQEQVRELLGKVEDMLQENGGWHFSLHMYQRMEEEWCRREQELRARLEAETDVGGGKRNQTTAEAKINMELEPEQRSDTEEEERGEDCLRIELKRKKRYMERKVNREEDEDEGVKVELSSEDDGWYTGSDSGGEREEGDDVKTELMAPFLSNGGQRLAFSPIRGIA
ncbi:GTPase IMAP family member 7 [Notolabrus celidotus]|uniref:GTPase IMAP family member 7 n=1 Tax=Notolabrus celidotus TaxID=1203425 RepID=UPI00148FA1A9|nr:GTPase IMAP family member 7 [Notolabrus celidotus]